MEEDKALWKPVSARPIGTDLSFYLLQRQCPANLWSTVLVALQRGVCVTTAFH